MDQYLLRQHLLLTEKHNSAELSWKELEKKVQLPTQQKGLYAHMKPSKPLKDYDYWYLVAKQNDLAEHPALKLSLSYSVALLSVCGLIISIFSVKILPSLSEFFEAGDSKLPAFTEIIVANVPSILGLLLLLLVSIVLPSLIINKLMKRNAPLPGWIKIFGIYNHWIKIHNQYVQSCKLQSWLAINTEISSADVSGLVGEEEWHLAKQNQLEKATIVKLTPAVDPFVNLKMNQHLDSILTVTIGLLIGALIVAFYLPIFQMGTLV